MVTASAFDHFVGGQVDRQAQAVFLSPILVTFTLIIEAKATLSRKSILKLEAILKKMLEDKEAIHQHPKKRRKIVDLKNKFKIVKPYHKDCDHHPPVVLII